MILSIDFDIIMSPIIQLYNDLVTPYDNRERNWDEIFYVRKIENLLSFDKEIYEKINKILLECFNQKKKIYIGRDHSSLLSVIAEYIKNKEINGPMEIINIDHHHDIYYNEDQIKNFTFYNYPCCGSWAGYLDNLNLLKKYYWINNSTSLDFFPLDNRDFLLNNLEITNIKDFEISSYDNIDFIYFCSSLSYIPPQYDDLFLFTLKLLIEEKEKNNGEIIYYNSSYNINVQDPIKELIFNGGGTIC